jgi:hypothetical protein
MRFRIYSRYLLRISLRVQTISYCLNKLVLIYGTLFSSTKYSKAGLKYAFLHVVREGLTVYILRLKPYSILRTASYRIYQSALSHVITGVFDAGIFQWDFNSNGMLQLGDLRHSPMEPCGMGYNYLLLFVLSPSDSCLGLHCLEFAREP